MQPIPVFLPRECLGQRSLVGYSPQGRQESDMTEATQYTYIIYYWMGQRGCSGFSITSYEKMYFGSDPLQYILYIQKKKKNPKTPLLLEQLFSQQEIMDLHHLEHIQSVSYYLYIPNDVFGVYFLCISCIYFCYSLPWLDKISVEERVFSYLQPQVILVLQR